MWIEVYNIQLSLLLIIQAIIQSISIYQVSSHPLKILLIFAMQLFFLYNLFNKPLFLMIACNLTLLLLLNKRLLVHLSFIQILFGKSLDFSTLLTKTAFPPQILFIHTQFLLIRLPKIPRPIDILLISQLFEILDRSILLFKFMFPYLI